MKELLSLLIIWLFSFSLFAEQGHKIIYYASGFGLNQGESQFINTQYLIIRNGEEIENGSITRCVDNNEALFSIYSDEFNLIGAEEFEITYSICPTKYIESCRKITTVWASISKNEDNIIEATPGSYLLDLSPYSGQLSPCTHRVSRMKGIKLD